MIHQAAPSFDAEYARVVKAVETAQARTDDFERIVNDCMDVLTKAAIPNDAPLDQLVARMVGQRDALRADLAAEHDVAVEHINRWKMVARAFTREMEQRMQAQTQLEETQRARDELRARIDHYLAERDISDLMHDAQTQERSATRRWAQLWKRGMQAQMRARGYWRDEARRAAGALKTQTAAANAEQGRLADLVLRADHECAKLRASAAQAFRTCDQSRRAYVEAHRQSEARVAALRAALGDLLAGAEQQGQSDVAAKCRAALGGQS